MAIPAVILIAGGLATISGGAAAISGSSKMRDAKDLFKKARRRYNNAVNRQRKAVEARNECAAGLCSYKAFLVNTVLPPSIALLKERYRFSCKGPGNTIRAEIVTPELAGRLNRQLSVMDAAGIGIKAIGAGYAAGSGACALVGLLGTASTGTAIGSLTGAAAQSATMAWFGGGALSAGGAGVAGGTAVLGGLVVAPAAILVGGIAISIKAEKVYTNAVAQSAELRRKQAKIASSCRLIRAVDTRIVEIHECLAFLENKLKATLSELSARRTILDILFRRRRHSENARIIANLIVANLVAAILDVIEAPIFDQELGEVSVESERVLFRYGNTNSDEA